jgi:glycosyltransferase involved in cell wall biosynthesis
LSGRPELVLLTAEYPFGNRSEPFLETEVEVLAERFPRIYVLPSHQRDGLRSMPANVELVGMDWLEEPARRAKRAALASREAARVFRWTLRTPGDLGPQLASRTYLDILARNILKLRSLKRFVRKRRVSHAIFYDYWFENSTLALALLREAGAIGTAVSRAHGFDVYDERWDGRPVPFRQAKARSLDALFAVSIAGRAYLEERVPGLRGKVRVQRLGVRDPGRVCPADTVATPLIVTCGNLIAIKRVHLVPEVLTRLGRPVRWVHFGDGPERPRVEAAISSVDGGDQWTLLGDVENREVLRFYGRNHVSALLSLRSR